MIRNLLFVVGSLFLITSLQAKNEIEIISSSNSEIILKAEFNEPDIVTYESGQVAVIEGLQLMNREGFPVIPILSKMLSLPSDKVSFEIQNIKTVTKKAENYLFYGLAEEIDLNGNIVKSGQKDWLELTYQGLFRKMPVFSIDFYPVRVKPEQKIVQSIREISVRIWVNQQDLLPVNYKSFNQNEKKFNSGLLLNGSQLNFQTTTSVPSFESTQKYKSGRFKIIINEDGLYQVSYDDLQDAGMNMNNVDARKLRLYNKGREIPIYVESGADQNFGPNDYFEFWGEKNYFENQSLYPDMHNDPFTPRNVYWLEISAKNGLRMVDESGALIKTNPAQYIVPYAYTERVHFEEDNHFEHFGQSSANGDKLSHTIDNWFYDSGVAAVGSRSYSFDLPYPLESGSNSVFVKTMLRGRTYFEENYNEIDRHMVDVWLNDKKIGSSTNWKDQNAHVITNEGTFGAAQADIAHGENELRLVMDQVGVSDVVLLNWFEIQYLRKYRASDNKIIFRKQENLPENYTIQFEVDGFSSPNIEVYKKGISKIKNTRIDFYQDIQNFSSYRVSFQDDVFYSGIEYVALTPNLKKSPLEIVPDFPWKPESTTNSSLLDESNIADYIIVTNNLLYENTLLLRDYRRQQGLNVEVVKVQDIYDEFNYGIKSPVAIHNFFKYAFEKWNQTNPLQYVALFGDADKNYEIRGNTTTDLVPTYLFQTYKFGAAATDYAYSMVSGEDEFPDLIIGRVPVNNNTELMNYIEKMIEYEKPENVGEWKNTALFISGNDANEVEYDNTEPAFRAQNQRLINYQLPEGFFAKKLNTIRDTNRPDFDPNFGGTTDLINHFDDGLAIVNFLGHGGGGVWADVNLFDLQDAERINNGAKLPFVKSMTCFTGAYENPNVDGLAEKLIKVGERGAIGVLASSGLGYVHNDFSIGWTLTEYLLKKSFTIGEATMLTKIFYFNNNIYFSDKGITWIPDWGYKKRSMVYQYNLLGEPLVKIKVADDNLNISLSKAIPTVGDTVMVSVKAPFTEGTVRIELADDSHETLIENFSSLNQSTAQFEFIIPAELADQVGFVKAYASNETQEARGLSKIAVNKSFLKYVEITPQNPQIGDSIYFAVHIESQKDIQFVKLVNLPANNGQNFILTLSQLNDSVFVSPSGFGPYTNAGLRYFDVEMIDTLGQINTIRNNYFEITDPRPDVKFTPNSVRFSGSIEVKAESEVFNESPLASQFTVKAYVGNYDVQSAPLFEQAINLNANEKQKLSLLLPSSAIKWGEKVYWVLDSESEVSEKNESNNVDSSLVYRNYINISKDLGTSKDGISNDTLFVNSHLSLYVPPNALNISSTLSINPVTDQRYFRNDTQPDYDFVPQTSSGDTIAYLVSLNNPESVFIEPGFIEFKIDTGIYDQQYLGKVDLYRYIPNLNQWIQIDQDTEDNRNFAQITKSGIYALFHVDDSKEPVIEITINGRNLRENMLIPANPELAVILQDENGINLTEGFSIKIDNQEIPAAEINLPDSISSSSAIAIQATPTIEKGEHQLTVSVKDASGQEKTTNVNFVVTDEFDLVVYGNYPNPFTDETYISYNVVTDGLLDEFYVKIYTVSGRMINKLDTDDQKYIEPDYHEILWDGRDSDGNIVANGVYFAVIFAKYEGKTKEIRLKLAKLK